GVGQIIIRKHWHKYVYNEDVVVDIAYRKQGIGTLLLEQAKG
ncbi:MAG: GNAT family N-acetyltransferase, partial [Theionarchaea archaeon]|nr:GNAT family N-acetyltransferase [Theionarchaea archaeon]